jgi:hypothetical protein
MLDAPPLDITQTGEPTESAMASSDEPLAGAPPVLETAISPPELAAVALAPASPPQLLLTPDTSPSLVAYTPPSAGAEATADEMSQLPDMPYPGATDPEELAARHRVTALYASIEHGECKGGWGPTPKMLNAQRVTPGHLYYMEIRLRHTPMLPVGHVYIAYGNLDTAGQPVDEKLVMLAPVGGYVGAGVASAVPMPGILQPHPTDCVVEPEASYRLSLTALQYEKLLLAVQSAKRDKPSYHLFAYNCNHFMSDIASSVGVLPPANVYQPSLIYFYEMVDRNEGRKVPRTPAFMTASAYPAPARQ